MSWGKNHTFDVIKIVINFCILNHSEIRTFEVRFPVFPQPTPKAIPHEFTLDTTRQVQLRSDAGGITQVIY